METGVEKEGVEEEEEEEEAAGEGEYEARETGGNGGGEKDPNADGFRDAGNEKHR